MDNTFIYFIKTFFKIDLSDLITSYTINFQIDDILEKLKSYGIQSVNFDLQSVETKNINFPFLFYDTKQHKFTIVTKLTSKYFYLKLPEAPFYIPYPRKRFMDQETGFLILLLDRNYQVQKKLIEFNYYCFHLFVFCIYILVSCILYPIKPISFTALNWIFISVTYYKIITYRLDRAKGNLYGNKCQTLGSECYGNDKEPGSYFRNLDFSGISLVIINIIIIMVIFKTSYFHDYYIPVLEYFIYITFAVTATLFTYNLLFRKKPCLKCFILHLLFGILCFNLLLESRFKFPGLSGLNFNLFLFILLVAGITALTVSFIIKRIASLRIKKIRLEAINKFNVKIRDLNPDQTLPFLKSISKLNRHTNDVVRSLIDCTIILYDPMCNPCYIEAFEKYNFFINTEDKSSVSLVPVFLSNDNRHRKIYLTLKKQLGMLLYDTEPIGIEEEFILYQRNVMEIVKIIGIKSYPQTLYKGKLL